MEIARTPDGSVDLAVGLAQVRAAADRLRPHVRETPCVYSYTFSEGAGCDVHLKLENLQRTGSFKVRGSLNGILGLDAEQSRLGLVAASAGNHAQGVALAAKLAGVEATIVMPRATPLVKLRRTEDYGARVVRHGESWDEAQSRALEIARERGCRVVHPFDDPDVIIGQGTVGLEVLAQVPDMKTLVVPVGGGGLICGVAIAIKALAPEVRLVGVQASGADAMARSFASGQLETVEHPRTIADGIRVGRPGALTLGIARELVDELVSVTDEEISTAVVETLQKSKVLAEAAGIVGVAAVASGRLECKGPVCVLVSGGNIDMNLLGRLIESGLANQGFYHPVQIRLKDAPGQLQTVLEALTETESNIVDIQHYRAGWRVPVGYVDVEILLETRRADQAHDIEARLRAFGLDVREG